MKMEQSVPKRRHIKFRRRGITQKKAYNIQDTAKVWNQERMRSLQLFHHDLQQFWSRPRGTKSLILSHIPSGYNSHITFLSYIRTGSVDKATREKAALTTQQGPDVFTSDKITTELQLLSSQKDCGLRNCQVVWCTFMASWQHALHCYKLVPAEPQTTTDTQHRHTTECEVSGFHGVFISIVFRGVTLRLLVFPDVSNQPRRGISYTQWKEGRQTGLVTSCVGTFFWNTLLKGG